MSYLKQKPGSIEEVIKGLSSKVLESDYQNKFKKELEKTGKGIGSMTPAEKKAFFNKIDKMHSAKDEQSSEKQIDKFHKKLDNLVHKSFGHSSDEKKKEMKEEVKEGGPGSGPQGNSAKKTNFSSAQIKQAYGILNDPRYKAGNYSGAVKTINKVTPGLADHPDVKKALMRANEANEEKELDEKASMAKMYTKKASNGDVEVFYRGRTKYGNNKQIGYYHKQGSKFVAYHDNSDDEDDFTQSDTYNDERSAQMTILQTAAKNRVITEGMETMVPTKKDDEKDMNRKVTMTGEKPTKVDTKPKVDYNK